MNLEGEGDHKGRVFVYCRNQVGSPGKSNYATPSEPEPHSHTNCARVASLKRLLTLL